MVQQLYVVAQIKARPGKEDELRRVLLTLIEPTRAEDGCVQYDLHVHATDPSRFVFYENWTSREHLDRHLASPHLSAAVATAGEWLAEPPSIETYWRIACLPEVPLGRSGWRAAGVFACGILTGMWELRLGDEIDDYCIKCRRLTNHSIVSMVETKAAKVRCRTCYSDHDFRNEQAPPSKKELARQKELFNAVLAGVAPAEVTAAAAAEDDPPVLPEPSVEPEAAAAPVKAKKKKA